MTTNTTNLSCGSCVTDMKRTSERLLRARRTREFITGVECGWCVSVHEKLGSEKAEQLIPFGVTSQVTAEQVLSWLGVLCLRRHCLRLASSPHTVTVVKLCMLRVESREVYNRTLLFPRPKQKHPEPSPAGRCSPADTLSGLQRLQSSNQQKEAKKRNPPCWKNKV